jgi:DNA-binding response OmpR family regulator
MSASSAPAAGTRELILVVDDEAHIVDLVRLYLEREGYRVRSAGSGPAALSEVRSHPPAMVILDVMLPGMDGFEVCRVLRRETSVPILMLTARAGEVDRVVGLEVGADDYLTKPFSVREFLARVKALLRRVRLDREGLSQGSMPLASGALVSGDLTIDVDRHEALLKGTSLHLKPKEFELLLFLARHRGIALSRDLILERVWGWDYGGGTRTVDVHIRWLREKIEPSPADPQRIATVRGVGYCFEG